MSLKIKESELKDILAEVAEDLAKAFRSTEGQLAKADGDGPPHEEPDEDEGGAPPAEGSESAPPADDASPGGPPPPDASASPDASPSPQGMDPAAEQSQALTPEALQAEYSKLSPEELDMHIKAALSAKAIVAGSPDAGGMPGPGGPPGAPPMAMGAPPMDASAGGMPPPMGASPSPGGMPPPPLMPPPTMKNELPASPERNGKDSIDSLGKSEFQAIQKKNNEEMESLRALMKSQAEEIETLTKIAQKLAEQPLRKAVTSVAHLPKTAAEAPKEFTRATIQTHLKNLSARPDMKKSDRQLINDFYDGRVKIDRLAHLFEDVK